MRKQNLKDKIRELEIENYSLSLKLEKQKEFITRFVMFVNNMMSSHDTSLVTSMHVSRVANMIDDSFRLFPKKLFEKRTTYDYEIFCNSVRLGAYLHDLGKFHIPHDILTKNGKLTNEEFEIVKNHPSLGSIDIIDLPLDESCYNKVIINNIILHHHSNTDGSGYPDGLTASEIPFEALYVAVFDRLEALLAKRTYKDCYSLEQAIKILRDSDKTDKEILDLVESNFDSFNKYSYIGN